MNTLIRRTIVPGHAYGAVDIDRYQRGPIAYAFQFADGWQVRTRSGRTVAAKLSRRSALSLMDRTANQLLDRAAVRALLSGGIQ